MAFYYDSRNIKNTEEAVSILEELMAIKPLILTNVERDNITKDIVNLSFDITTGKYSKSEKQQRNKNIRRDESFRRVQKRKEKDNIEFLYNNSSQSLFLTERKNGYYKRHYRRRRSKYLKRASNKKIRKSKSVYQKKGSNHKKIFDYWWKLD